MAEKKLSEFPELSQGANLTNVKIPVVESGANKLISATNLLTSDASSKLDKVSIDQRLTQDSTQDAQYNDGNFSLHELGFANGNAKAITAYRNAMASTSPDSIYFPYRQVFSDKLGRGHVNWAVAHYFLNKGYPSGWRNDAGTQFSGGGACPYIGLEIDRGDITTDSLYDANEVLTNSGHIITKTAHGFLNKQPVTLIPLAGFNTPIQTATRGLQYGHGTTYHVQVLSADTFRLMRRQNTSVPYDLIDPMPIQASLTFPSFPAAVTGATYAQTATTLTVTSNSHGLTRGMRVKMTFLTGTGKPADKLYEVMTSTTNTFTIEACLGAKETTVVSGNCSYLVNPTTFLVCSWDIHAHKSDERVWADGTVNTYDAVSYGEGDRGVRRINGLDLHLADCKVSITQPSGENLDFDIGTQQNVVQWRMRRGTTNNLDFFRVANNNAGVQQNIQYARFHNLVGGLVETSVPLRLTGGVNTASTTVPVIQTTSALARNVVKGQYDAVLQTTDATVTTIKSFPAVTVTTDGMATYEFELEAKQSMGGTPNESYYKGTIVLVRGSGSTTVRRFLLQHISNTIIGLTHASVTLTQSAGVLNIRVTGVAATTIDWTLTGNMKTAN